LASGTRCPGTVAADPPSDPATNDIPTGALSNSQRLIKTYNLHLLFITAVVKVQVKVKFTLEKAMSAQRGSRRIAILVI